MDDEERRERLEELMEALWARLAEDDDRPRGPPTDDEARGWG